uniref:Uncharacterized protein n=1 Tax=Micrurus lemniscatus lemniscatus TaxID=129467 RepID=A0A2D4HQG2_MICLE
MLKEGASPMSHPSSCNRESDRIAMLSTVCAKFNSSKITSGKRKQNVAANYSFFFSSAFKSVFFLSNGSYILKHCPLSATGTRRSLYSKQRASSTSMSSLLSFAEDLSEKLLGPANVLWQVLPPTFS